MHHWRCILFFITVVPFASQAQSHRVEIVSPAGGSPAPSSNPPVIEARIIGAILEERSFDVSIDGIRGVFQPEADGMDNDGDGLVDEINEAAVSWPAADLTRFRARWPWSLDLDNPGTPEMNEGVHSLLFTVRFPSGEEETQEVEFFLPLSGGADSVVVYPSPFDPKHQAAQIGYRLLTPGRIKIEVMDFQGRVVTTLAAWIEQDAGWHSDATRSWNGRDADGSIVANGVYFIKISYRNDTSSNEVVAKCFLAH